jgi:hypothetical protein
MKAMFMGLAVLMAIHVEIALLFKSKDINPPTASSPTTTFLASSVQSNPIILLTSHSTSRM